MIQDLEFGGDPDEFDWYVQMENERELEREREAANSPPLNTFGDDEDDWGPVSTWD